VRRGKLAAFVVVPAGFGKSAGLFVGRPPELEVGIDPSRKAEAGYLEGLLLQATFEIAQERLKDRDAMRGQMEKTLRELESSDMPSEQRENLKKFFADYDRFVGSVDASRMPKFEAARIRATDVTPERAGPKSSFEITFPSAILWGILGCAAAFAISIVTERMQGTYLRLRISPLTRMEILAGKGLACFAACLGVLVVLLGVGVAVFGVRVENPAALAAGALSTAVAFTGIMMLLCVLGKTEQSVAGAGWAILMVMAMLGGGMVPLMVMPEWMHTASHVSPVKWGILSLEGAIWRGFTLREMLLPCGILLGIGAVFFLVGVRVFSRRDA
jgi:ABC-2 type transport system permease protein